MFVLPRKLAPVPASKMVQVEAAVSHLEEAGESGLAIKTCIDRKLWRRALRLLARNIGPEVTEDLLHVAGHLEQEGDLNEAEAAYIQVGLIRSGRTDVANNAHSSRQKKAF